MSSFPKSFLREDIPSGVRVVLAAFGKHPGWDDHIDDLGLETQSLIAAKRSIYLEGIGGQIDSAGWDKLDSANRTEGFDHLFLWQRGAQSLLGCIASSRDGKGRSQYPIILCAQFVGIPRGEILQELRPIIERAMSACRATTVADDVRRIVAEARDQLRQAITAIEGGTVSAPPPLRPALTQLPGHAALGPVDEGLFRILYQVKNQLVPWARGRTGKGRDESAATGVHIRLPRVLEAEQDALEAWAELMGSQLDPLAPKLFLVPRRGSWVDVVIGETSMADFFGLRANTRAIPCASEVPYAMDDAFRGEAQALIAMLAAGSADARTIFGPLDSTPVSVRAAAKAEAREKLEKFSQKLPSLEKKYLVWGAVGAGLLAVIVTVILMSGGREATPAKPTLQPVITPPPKETVKTTMNEAPPSGAVENWRKLCQAYYSWAGPLKQALDDKGQGLDGKPLRGVRENWSKDEYLRKEIVARADGPSGLAQYDPSLLGESKLALNELQDAPPASLATPEMEAKVERALRAVTEIGDAVEKWPALAQVREDVAKLAGWGWTQPVAGLKVSEKIVLRSDLVSAVNGVLDARTALAPVVVNGGRFQASLVALEKSGDPSLAALAPVLRKGAVASKNLPELDKFLDAIIPDLEAVAKVISSDWSDGRIDQKQFLKERGADWATGMTEAALLKKWLAGVQGYSLVTGATAMLPLAEWQQNVAAARDALAQLSKVPDADPRVFSQRVAALEKQWADLAAGPAIQKEAVDRASKAQNLVGSMRALAVEIDAEVGRKSNPEAWLQQVRAAQISESATVDKFWQLKREELLSGVNAAALQRDFELRKRVESIQRSLREFIDAAVVVVPANLPDKQVKEMDPRIAKELKIAQDRRRESVLGTLLEKIQWAGTGTPTIPFADFWAKPPAKEIVADFNKAAGELADAGAELTRIARQLDEGYAWQGAGMSDSFPEGYWTKLNLGDSMPFISEVIQRFRDLNKLVATTDRAVLITTVRNGPLASATTAWWRLGELPDWLSEIKPDDLTIDLELSKALKTRGEKEITEKARAGFTKSIDQEMRTRWQNGLMNAKSDEYRRRLYGSATAFAVSDSDPKLSAEQRFNLKLSTWSKKAATIATAADRDTLVKELRGLAPTGSTSVALWLEQLEKVSFVGEQTDLTTLGPGKAGWTLEMSKRPDGLSFVWKSPQGRSHQLEFARVTLASGQSSYLGTTEVPVQLFIDWVDAKNLGQPVADSLRTMLADFAPNDPRQGPRSFAITKGGSASGWTFTRKENEQWLIPSLEQDEKAPRPTALTPVNYVSYQTAKLVCEALNCRLPKELEWQAAVKSELPDAKSPPPNLRDATWSQYVELLDAKKDFNSWPNKDIFFYGKESPMAKPKAASTSTDGFLWFDDVRSKSERTFSHLVGNVAEFVTDANDQPGVIGGSALSPPDMKVDQFYKASASDRKGYSDVGFRLAFSVEHESGAALVQRLLLTAPLLAEAAKTKGP